MPILFEVKLSTLILKPSKQKATKTLKLTLNFHSMIRHLASREPVQRPLRYMNFIRLLLHLIRSS